jgi:hypothetical protein
VPFGYFGTESGLPGLLRTLRSPCRHGFKHLQTDTAEMAVSAGAMIEQFPVFVDLSSSHLTSLIDALRDPLLLQAAKEVFCHGVISAVALPAHTGLQMMGITEAPQASRPHCDS